MSLREVDKIKAIEPRPVEMQVLCLGLSRTATMTMMTAMNQLGYKCYHMLETGAPQNKKEHHAACWREALRYKVYGIGKPYGPADFDKILQRYSAVADMPCVNFSDELVARFPNAKVVLTQRDPQKWVQSVDEVIYYILTWRIWKLIKYLDPDGAGAIRDCLELALSDWTSPEPYTDREALARYMPVHTAHIRSISKGKVLEFHPKDGWGPLCKFLGKDIPNQPFPHVNQGQHAANIIKIGLTIRLIKMFSPYLMAAGAVWMAWKWALSGRLA